MPLYEDPKYDIDEETAALPSTVKFFPKMTDLLDDEECQDNADSDNNNNTMINEWALKRFGALQMKLEKMQHSRDTYKSFGSRDNLTNFSRSILYNLANEVFGFDGWSTTILDCNLTKCENQDQSKFSAICIVKIRLTLKDGTFREQLGQAESTNMPYQYMCYATARKKAVTDAIKNAIIGLRDLYLEYEQEQIMKEFALDCVT